jgi:hypothetical protein
MLKIFFLIGFPMAILSCHSRGTSVLAPDLKTYFKEKLYSADSSLSLASFEFIKWDTLHERWTLKRERYPYQRDMAIVRSNLDSLTQAGVKNPFLLKDYDFLRRMEDLTEQETYLARELDSLNTRLADADTILPVGYIARYLYKIRKEDGTILTDTIGFSFTTELKMMDWDRNNEKNIDSIVSGKHPVLR